jgi:hypothetical protein
MAQAPEADLETDPRFPSGAWVGFWLQKHPPVGRHSMELHLTFRSGVINGEGRDWVAPFLVTGRYNLGDGHCHWTKRYVGRHDVFYDGFNEGKGIWGSWQIPGDPVVPEVRGGFYVWPKEMPDPSSTHLVAAAEVEQVVEAEEPVPAFSLSLTPEPDA